MTSEVLQDSSQEGHRLGVEEMRMRFERTSRESLLGADKRRSASLRLPPRQAANIRDRFLKNMAARKDSPSDQENDDVQALCQIREEAPRRGTVHDRIKNFQNFQSTVNEVAGNEENRRTTRSNSLISSSHNHETTQVHHVAKNSAAKLVAQNTVNTEQYLTPGPATTSDEVDSAATTNLVKSRVAAFEHSDVSNQSVSHRNNGIASKPKISILQNTDDGGTRGTQQQQMVRRESSDIITEIFRENRAVCQSTTLNDCDACRTPNFDVLDDLVEANNCCAGDLDSSTPIGVSVVATPRVVSTDVVTTPALESTVVLTDPSLSEDCGNTVDQSKLGVEIDILSSSLSDCIATSIDEGCPAVKSIDDSFGGNSRRVDTVDLPDNCSERDSHCPQLDDVDNNSTESNVPCESEKSSSIDHSNRDMLGVTKNSDATVVVSDSIDCGSGSINASIATPTDVSTNMTVDATHSLGIHSGTNVSLRTKTEKSVTFCEDVVPTSMVATFDEFEFADEVQSDDDAISLPSTVSTHSRRSSDSSMGSSVELVTTPLEEENAPKTTGKVRVNFVVESRENTTGAIFVKQIVSNLERLCMTVAMRSNLPPDSLQNCDIVTNAIEVSFETPYSPTSNELVFNTAGTHDLCGLSVHNVSYLASLTHDL